MKRFHADKLIENYLNYQDISLWRERNENKVMWRKKNVDSEC